MKIAQVVWPENSTPPKKYGPVQLVAANLANGLCSRGHQVTTFATADSTVKGKIIAVAKSATREDPTIPESLYYHSVTIAELIKHWTEFDIIHSHIGHSIITVLDVIKKPVVITSHGNYDNVHPREIYKKYAQKAYFVAISESQKKSLPGVNYAGVVYHGINVQEFKFSGKASNYMLYVGRTSPVKGLAPAIQASIATGLKLKIAVHTDETEAGKEYFLEKIEPYLGRESIDFLGEISQEQTRDLMRNAKLLIFPIQWEEPFGLVVAEANASGTPVVAFARGSMPEIIKEGVNGFLVESDNEQKLNATLKKVFEIPEAEYKKIRESSRRYAEANFTVGKMVDGYEKVYQKIINDFKDQKPKTKNTD